MRKRPSTIIRTSNSADFTSNTSGLFQLTGIATDINGNVGIATAALRVDDSDGDDDDDDD